MAKVILDTDTGEMTEIAGLDMPVMPVPADPFKQLAGVYYQQAYNQLVLQAFSAWMNCWNGLFK